MSSLIIICTPIILFLIAVATTFLNIKKIPGLVVTICLGIIALILVSSHGYVSHNIQAEKEETKATLALEQQWKKNQIEKLQGLLGQFRPQADAWKNQILQLSSFGWTTLNANIYNSLNADYQRMLLLESLPPILVHEPVLVGPLPEEVDLLITGQALAALGFKVTGLDPQPNTDENEESDEDFAEDEEDEYFDEEEAEEEEDFEEESDAEEDEENNKTKLKIQKPVKPNKKPINVMYYGKGVKNYEIKLIALTLIRAGANLKALRNFRKPTKDQYRKVEFNWSKTYRSRASLDPEEIRLQEKFKR